MRPRIFLRTREFLWQEGHTAHETLDEAEAEAKKMLNVYIDLAENCLAMPVVSGQKPSHEKFAGAVNTYTVEPMMQDGRALQAGTSHNLGDNFAKSAHIQFQGRDGKLHHAFTASWGVSTRLIGGVIMSHADDEGMVVPPVIAPHQVVIVPLYKDESKREAVAAYAEKLRELRPEEEIPAWSFRFLQAIPEVTVVLSGMSDEQQLMSNLNTFAAEKPLNAEEKQTLFTIAKDMTEKTSVPCTACRYCTTHCPQGLNIPYLLELYNEHTFTQTGAFIAPMALSALPADKQPSACLHCRRSHYPHCSYRGSSVDYFHSGLSQTPSEFRRILRIYRRVSCRRTEVYCNLMYHIL